MQKSFIVAAALAMVVSASAFAGNVSVGAEYENYNATKGGVDYNSVMVTPTYTTGPVVLDLRIRHARTTDRDIFNVLEAGAKYNMAVTKKLTASLRGSYGVMFANGQTADFYTIEPGVTYAVTNKVSVNGSYRFRDAFASSSSFDQTNTVFVGADYAMSKTNVVSVKAFRETSDVSGDGVQVAFAHTF